MNSSVFLHSYTAHVNRLVHARTSTHKIYEATDCEHTGGWSLVLLKACGFISADMMRLSELCTQTHTCQLSKQLYSWAHLKNRDVPPWFQLSVCPLSNRCNTGNAGSSLNGKLLFLSSSQSWVCVWLCVSVCVRVVFPIGERTALRSHLTTRSLRSGACNERQGCVCRWDAILISAHISVRWLSILTRWLPRGRRGLYEPVQPRDLYNLWQRSCAPPCSISMFFCIASNIEVQQCNCQSNNVWRDDVFFNERLQYSCYYH